jgi:DNA-binding transcriptional LysR family regulator
MRTILMCLEFFDEDESLRLLHCNVHRTREMIRGKLQRQKTEIPGNPMRAVEDMETFVVVAREGSFAAAARRLGVSTSVVADAIARLERRLDVRLTLRTTRRQTLTDAGREYAAEATGILERVGALEERIRDSAGDPRGDLRVTAPTPVGRRWVAPFVAGFAQRYPDIRVTLTLDDSFADIVGEGFDVAIRGGPAVDSGFMGRRLFEMRRVVVASPAYLAERRAPERPEDLARHRCLVFNNGRHFHADWRFGRGARARSVRVEGALATNNSELPVVWALAGLGLAQKSLWEVAEPLARGALVTVLNDFEPDPATFFAIHPVSRSQSRKIGLFVEQLARFLAPNLV